MFSSFKRKTERKIVDGAQKHLDKMLEHGEELHKKRVKADTEKAEKNKRDFDGNLVEYVEIDIADEHSWLTSSLNDIMSYYPEYDVLTITSYAGDMLGVTQTLYLKLKDKADTLDLFVKAAKLQRHMNWGHSLLCNFPGEECTHCNCGIADMRHALDQHENKNE